MKLLTLTKTMISGVLLCSVLAPVYAEQPNEKLQIQKNVIQIIKPTKEVIKLNVRTNMATRTGVIRKIIDSKAFLRDTILKTKSDTSLTVEKDNKTYTITTDDKTLFRRRFMGISELDEMQIGDSLEIIGTWTDEDRTTIHAKLVRDISIQVRYGVFIGFVESTSDSDFSVKTVNRGNQVVIVDTKTKYVNRQGVGISKNDISVGHRIRIKGLWNRSLNTISEVQQVKDYNLPVRITPTLSPKATSSATLTE